MKEQLKIFIFPLVLFLLVSVLAAFKIHGSSIGIWNQIIYGKDYQDPNLLFGQLRGIRSDEWLVSTPLTIAQEEARFEDNNSLFLAGQKLILTDSPVKSWAVFEPQNWPFFLLPVEQAFAFRWWFKALLLAVAVYFLAIIISKNNIVVSAIAAVSFLYSPYIQWWYSTEGKELAAFGIFTFIFFIRMVDNLSYPLFRWLNAFFFTYFAICFVLTLYPPYQIPIGIFFALMGTGYVLSARIELSDNKNWARLIFTVLLCLTAVGITVFLYYYSNETAIHAMTNTVYPGSRQAVGGENGFLLKVMAGFYNIQLLNDARTLPDFLVNQSEASSYFFFSIFLLPFYLYFWVFSAIRNKPVDLLLIFSLFGFVLLLLWELIGLPSFIAKLLLLNNVPVNRTMFSLGIINHVLIIYYIACLNISQGKYYRLVAAIYSVAVFALVFFFGRYISVAWPGFIGSEGKILFIAVVCGVLMALLLYQQKLAFFSLFLAFTLVSTINVNPIYRGLSPLRDPHIVKAIKNIKENDAQAGWAVYDHLLFGNYLASNGIRVLNGTYLHPNLNFWSHFDPEYKYSDIYNRYSFVFVMASTDPENVEFSLPSDTIVQLEISPCNPLLEDVGVKYHLFSSQRSDVSCLSLVEEIEFPSWTLYLYEHDQ